MKTIIQKAGEGLVYGFIFGIGAYVGAWLMAKLVQSEIWIGILVDATK